MTDIVLAFPLAYHAARLATPRARNALLIAVVLPLWANYLVRVFAWKLILTPSGFLNWLVESLALGSLQVGRSNWAIWITSVYLWLPFTLLPIYAAIERVPTSFLEASGDLGARGWFTFRRVMFPLILPGIVAGSIFSFSLTLGDYIVPELVGNTQFIGNVIYDNVGVAGNVPLAAAFALVPIAVMARLPVARETAGRVRGALTHGDPGRTRILIRAGSVAHPGVPLRSARDRGDLRVQRRGRAVVADPGLHHEVVRDRVPLSARVAGRSINSLQVALFATVIALILGSAAAFAVHRFRFFGRNAVSFLLVLPIALPGIVTAIALNSTINTFGVPFGVLTIVIGARDVLHRGRVQQRARSAPTDARRR